MMLLNEVEAPLDVYSGPRHSSYFNFIDKGVFAWAYAVGDHMVHIGSAVHKRDRARKEDMRFDEFVEHLTGEGYLSRDFEPKDHHVTGGQIRMFSGGPMSCHGGTCQLVGDSAGLLQTDAYNGVTNAILSGKQCARALASGDVKRDLRGGLSRYLFQDIAKDMLSAPLRALRRGSAGP
jgi:flavin-dependent dehydrogenase